MPLSEWATHTDAETADALDTAGHRSGQNKPFTAGIVVHIRHKYHLPSHADRLRAQGLLTANELAQRLRVHRSTIKNWTRAGILNSDKANDKNERLYQPPIPATPASPPTRQPLKKRVTPGRPRRRHYEATPLTTLSSIGPQEGHCTDLCQPFDRTG